MIVRPGRPYSFGSLELARTSKPPTIARLLFGPVAALQAVTLDQCEAEGPPASCGTPQVCLARRKSSAVIGTKNSSSPRNFFGRPIVASSVQNGETPHDT